MTRCANLEPWQVQAAIDGRLRGLLLPVREQPVQITTNSWGWAEDPAPYSLDSLRINLEIYAPIKPSCKIIGRECWRLIGLYGGPCSNRIVVDYKADNSERILPVKQNMFANDPKWLFKHFPWKRWRSAATMPREFARWHWACTTLRAVRTTEVTHADAKGLDVLDSEVIRDPERFTMGDPESPFLSWPLQATQTWWDRKYGKRFGMWKTGPWVWLVGLEAK